MAEMSYKEAKEFVSNVYNKQDVHKFLKAREIVKKEEAKKKK
jgi:hypothetical protein